LVGNLAEDNVLAIEPAGRDGCNEELRAVAIERGLVKYIAVSLSGDLRVGPSVGHGEKTLLGVLLDEVLIRELVAVD
jgi:hypothetical protein